MPPAPLPPREIGAVNWIGIRTLVSRELTRTLKIAGQTVLAPMVTTLLFVAVFSLALADPGRTVAGVPFLEFIGPGLATMATMQAAFQSTASALIIIKIQNNLPDLTMPPLAPWELTVGFAAAGVVRGLLVGAATVAALWLVMPIAPPAPLTALFFAVNAALMLSLIGLVSGIVGSKFDHIATVSNFAITPLAFLSGTFYTIERLPEPWREAAHFNPFFHLIDGVRYGFTGHADGALASSAAVLLAINALLWLLCRTLFARGYRLRG